MTRSNVQSYINMASALVVFIGGITITVFFPGGMEMSFRWIIALFVTFYFIMRMAQAIQVIRRNNRKENSSLHELVEGKEDIE
ncbi:MAG: hypothetical protein R3F48_06985 [Candidatus Zixiibacteriota bacterium]